MQPSILFVDDEQEMENGLRDNSSTSPADVDDENELHLHQIATATATAAAASASGDGDGGTLQWLFDVRQSSSTAAHNRLGSR